MKLLLAVSKTGGHIFPALSVARELLRREDGSRVLLTGSEEGISRRIFAAQGLDWKGIKARPLYGAGPAGKIKALASLAGAVSEAREIMRDFRPDKVVGFGGYSSAAVLLAAVREGIPCYLHEQNLLPGLSNRLLARLAKKVFLSLPGSEVYFPAGKSLLTGNPVREEIGEAPRDYGAFGLEEGRFTLLVFGGSQGARSINAAMMEALEFWPRRSDACQVLHQTGQQDAEAVREAYRRAGVRACVGPFIENMAGAYAVADLVVCRAGATSIAEIMRAGKAALLIPYPYAAADHQVYNARYLADNGAGRVLLEKGLSGRRLAECIENLEREEEVREKLGRCGRMLARPEAAKVIVDYLLLSRNQSFSV